MYAYIIQVADLMDELGVHEKTADASFTPDPYDPSGYSVRCSLHTARSAVREYRRNRALHTHTHTHTHTNTHR
jgi:hypothetical protein